MSSWARTERVTMARLLHSSCAGSTRASKLIATVQAIPAKGSAPWIAGSSPAMTENKGYAGSSSRALGLEVRVHDRAIAGQRGRLDDIVIPVDRERLGFFVDQHVKEREKIFGVET